MYHGTFTMYHGAFTMYYGTFTMYHGTFTMYQWYTGNYDGMLSYGHLPSLLFETRIEVITHIYIYITILQADVIVHLLKYRELPFKRPRGQMWILATQEPGHYLKSLEYTDEKFNWTITHRLVIFNNLIISRVSFSKIRIVTNSNVMFGLNSHSL